MSKRKLNRSVVGPLLVALLLCPNIASGSEEKEVTPRKPFAPAEARDRRNMMLGKWLGEVSLKGGGVQRWLAERFPDGTYRIQFQILRAGGEYREQIEVGYWGISGPIYFGMYRGRVEKGEVVGVDPTEPRHYDAYEILEMTADHFRYRHVESQNEYLLRRVPQNYVLPPADGA